MICPDCNYDMDDSFMCPKCGYSAKEYKPSYQPKVVVKKPPFGILFFFALIEIIICLPAGIIAVVCNNYETTF